MSVHTCTITQVVEQMFKHKSGPDTKCRSTVLHITYAAAAAKKSANQWTFRKPYTF